MSSEGNSGNTTETEETTRVEEDSPLDTVLEGAGIVFGGRIVKLVLGFIAQVIVARLLGTTSYGELSLAMTVIGFAGLIAGLGMGSGVSRNVSYYEDEPIRSRGIVRSGLVITIVSNVAVATILFTFAPIISSQLFSNPDLTQLIRIAALGMPFGALGSIGTSVASGSRDATTHTIVNQIAGPVVRSILVAGLVALGYGVTGAVLGRTVATVLMSGVALWLAWRVFPWDIRGKADPMYRELLTFSLPLMFTGWMTHFIDETDFFILGIHYSESLVGIYTAIFRLQPMILLFYFPATFLLSPVITRLQKQRELTQARETYRTISKWTTLASLPIFLLGILFPETVIRVTFGSNYIQGATVLQLLMISGFITVMFGDNDRALVGLGHSKTSLYSNSAAAASNVALNLVLIPPLGMIGAAIATVTAFAVRNIINTILLYQWYSLTPFSLAMGKVILVVAFITPAGYFAFTQLFTVNLVSVVAIGIVFLFIYIPLVIRIGASESVDGRIFRQLEESSGMDLSRLKRVIRWISA